MVLDFNPTRPSGLYECAYLCGNAIRVAEVALVALWQEGHIKVAFKRQRAYVLRPGPTRHPIEAAALEAIPTPGRSLWHLLILVAAHPAMADVEAALREQGVKPRRRLLESPQTRRMRKQCMGDPGDGLRRVAVLGTPGIADERLRQAFAASNTRLSRLTRRTGWRGDDSVDSTASYQRILRLVRALERDMERHAETAGDSAYYGGGSDFAGGDFGGFSGGDFGGFSGGGDGGGY